MKPSLAGNCEEDNAELSQKLELLEKIYSEVGELKKDGKPKASPEIVDIGYRTAFTKRICYADVYLFSLVSGDWNPIHHNSEFAEKTRFKKRIAHGMLTSSLVSAALSLIPGTVILLKSSQEYLKPVYLGDTITAEAEVAEKLPKNRYTVRIRCKNQNDKAVRGECTIFILEKLMEKQSGGTG